MTAQDIYEKETGNKAPDNQIAHSEWYIEYVGWLEKQAVVLRQPFVSGMFPTEEEIEKEAEGRYPVITHNNPDNSPYVGAKKTFIHGVRWGLAYVQCTLL